MNSVTKDQINSIIRSSEIRVSTLFDTCTMVAMKLPNGFILTETSACVDPDNYSETLGREICMQRLVDKLWELEGYLLMDKLSYVSGRATSDE